MDSDELSAGDLLRAVRDGRRELWPELVDRFSAMVLAVAGRYRLSDADVDDVYQAAWLRLAENLDRIRDPDRVAGWLLTTTRNEALRVSRRRVSLVLDDEPPSDEKSVEQLVDEMELTETVAAAMAGISEKCRTLLRLLLVDGRSYAEVCQLLSMPVGSIGPIRQRCLGYLRRSMLELSPTLQ